MCTNLVQVSHNDQVGISHLLWVEAQAYWLLLSRAPNMVGLTTQAHRMWEIPTQAKHHKEVMIY